MNKNAGRGCLQILGSKFHFSVLEETCLTLVSIFLKLNVGNWGENQFFPRTTSCTSNAIYLHYFKWLLLIIISLFSCSPYFYSLLFVNWSMFCVVLATDGPAVVVDCCEQCPISKKTFTWLETQIHTKTVQKQIHIWSRTNTTTIQVKLIYAFPNVSI